MTFQSYMKPPVEKHNVDKWKRDCPPLSKRELQERFIRYCEAGGLTACATLRHVTSYPKVPADKIKILHSPKF